MPPSSPRSARRRTAAAVERARIESSPASVRSRRCAWLVMDTHPYNATTRRTPAKRETVSLRASFICQRVSVSSGRGESPARRR